ncbi:hypothetical protein QBC37DRAFT_405546 [Rhypophila decipiens]|uniref:Uncharacterized protein n=1 Tax=Rhypophila decipiens TaxID=261697 RepID=A0AAN7B268_9PEZI|nr:hypothetical protein QBC37DRAFT_405546 [Rhypophila decipiens]
MRHTWAVLPSGTYCAGWEKDACVAPKNGDYVTCRFTEPSRPRAKQLPGSGESSMGLLDNLCDIVCLLATTIIAWLFWLRQMILDQSDCKCLIEYAVTRGRLSASTSQQWTASTGGKYWFDYARPPWSEMDSEASEVERNLPPTLKQRMDDKDEQSTFSTWFKSYCTTNMQELCSWDHVIEELRDARRVYEEKGQKNPVRRALRHGASISRAVMPLIDSLPQENGAGLLQGAIKIIFHAVQRRSDTCEKIFEAFENIPQTIKMAETLRGIYPNEESLLRCLGGLYYQLTKSLPQLIDVLLRRANCSAIKKHCKSIFGDSLAEGENILRPITEAERRLLMCQRQLDSKRIAQTSNHSQITLEKVEIMIQRVTEMDANVGGHITTAMHTLEPLLENLRLERDKSVETLWQENTWLRQHIDHLTKMANTCYISMEEILRCRAIASEIQQARPELHRESRQARNRQIGVAVQVTVPITVCSNKQQAVPAQDLYLIRRKYHSFSTTAVAQAQYLLTVPRFMMWLWEPGSDMLLVDGHCKDHSIG